MQMFGECEMVPSSSTTSNVRVEAFQGRGRGQHRDGGSAGGLEQPRNDRTKPKT